MASIIGQQDPNFRPIKISDVKSRMLNLAQTSAFSVRISPPSPVQDYLTTSGREFNYSLDGQVVELGCFDAKLPGTSLATVDMENDYSGVRERQAYRRMFDNTMDFSFYVNKDYDVIELFDGWIDYINGIGVDESDVSIGDLQSTAAFYRMRYPKGSGGYKCNFTIRKFEKSLTRRENSPSRFLTYTFVDGFPLNIISSPISYNNSDVLRVTISMAYTRYTRTRGKIANSSGDVSGVNAAPDAGDANDGGGILPLGQVIIGDLS